MTETGKPQHPAGDATKRAAARPPGGPSPKPQPGRSPSPNAPRPQPAQRKRDPDDEVAEDLGDEEE